MMEYWFSLMIKIMCSKQSYMGHSMYLFVYYAMMIVVKLSLDFYKDNYHSGYCVMECGVYRLLYVLLF